LFWLLYLPFYFFLYPPFRLTMPFFKPIHQEIKRLGKIGDEALKEKATSASLPVKRLCAVLFIVWLFLFPYFPDNSLVVWIPALLAFPFWLSLLKAAYRCAAHPRTIALLLLKICSTVLKQFSKEKAQKKSQGSDSSDDSTFHKYIRGAIKLAIRRYNPEALFGCIQRESMLIFTLMLSLALIFSAIFWGLVAYGILRTNPAALDAYSFFSDRSLLEATIWAFGCMTTAISFPGSAALLWVKVVHLLIVLTGFFQLTYLFACFSVVTETETKTATRKVESLLLEILKELKTADGEAPKGIDNPTK